MLENILCVEFRWSGMFFSSRNSEEDQAGSNLDSLPVLIIFKLAVLFIDFFPYNEVKEDVFLVLLFKTFQGIFSVWSTIILSFDALI